MNKPISKIMEIDPLIELKEILVSDRKSAEIRIKIIKSAMLISGLILASMVIRSLI